jgi:hypothetical protein
MSRGWRLWSGAEGDLDKSVSATGFCAARMGTQARSAQVEVEGLMEW